MLMRTLATGYFLPESVVVPGVFQDQRMVMIELPGNILPTYQQQKGGGRKITGRLAQEVEANPSPLPELQVGSVFKIHLSIDMAKEMTWEPVPLIDSGRLFCLDYQLKVVCNSNCSVCHSHRRLSLRYHGLLTVWKAQF